jgi:hypothetical protein
MLFRSVIECLLYKPFGPILEGLCGISQSSRNCGSVYVIQRPKNNPRNEDTVVPHIRRSSTQKSSSKVLAPVFWDKDGILLADCLMKGATTTAEYCLALLNEPNQQLVSKRRGKLSKGILFLQGNAVPRKVANMHQKLADLRFEVLTEPLRTTAYFLT